MAKCDDVNPHLALTRAAAMAAPESEEIKALGEELLLVLKKSVTCDCGSAAASVFSPSSPILLPLQGGEVSSAAASPAARAKKESTRLTSRAPKIRMS